MEFKDYLRILRRRFKWFVFTFVLAILIFFATRMIQRDIYVKTTNFYLRPKISDISVQISMNLPIELSTYYAISYRLLQFNSSEMKQKYAELMILYDLAKSGRISVDVDKLLSFQDVDKSLKEANIGENTIKTYLDKISGRYSFGSNNVDTIKLTVYGDTPEFVELLSKAISKAILISDREEVYSTVRELLDLAEKEVKTLTLQEKKIREKISEYSSIEQNLKALSNTIQNIEGNINSLNSKKSEIGLKLNKVISDIKNTRGFGISLEPVRSEYITQRVSELKGEYSKLKTKLQEELKTKTSEHPTIKNLVLELKAVDEEIQKEITIARNSYYKKLREEKEIVETQLGALKKQLDEKREELLQVENKNKEYLSQKNELEKISSALRNAMETRRRAKSIESIGINRGFIIQLPDLGEITKKPSRLGLLSNLLLCLIIAIIIGIAVAFLREYLSVSISNEHDVRVYLNWKVMGIIPKVPDREMISLPDEKTPIAEVFNTISAVFTTHLNKNKIVSLSSFKKGEGKTTVCINLGAALANRNLKVLLLDCDLRNSKLMEHFGVKLNEEFNSFVNSTSFEKYIHETKVSNLYVFRRPKIKEPIKFLSSDILEKLLNNLSQKFDYVIIDTPPILSVSDSLIIAKKSDAVIVVIKTDAVTREEARWGKHLLDEVNANVIGVLLNFSERASSEYYYYYYYSHYAKGS